MLGQALAQQIANEITDVIGHNVLITDESGIVVGSGDESRIGQFHEASVEVVRSRRTIAHSSEDVRDLVGTLPGVTIPLVIDDTVVGTIGLSGSPDEVVQFGLVVKRQTEILMQEAARIGTRMMHERATAELLREICEWHHSRVPKAQLMQRGRTLGHDLTMPRRIVLIQWADTSRADADAEHVVRHVEDVFHSADDLIAPLARMVVAVATPDTGDSVMDRCRDVVAGGEGARRGCSGRNWIHWSGYRRTERRVARCFRRTPVGADRGAGDQDSPDRTRATASSAVGRADRLPSPPCRRAAFTSVGRPRVDDIARDANRLGDGAFNTTRAAERLHVHRNTLIYRLDKIARALQRSLDEPGLAVALYVTCVIDELGRPKHADAG